LTNNNNLIGRHEFKYLAEIRRLFDVKSGASHVIRDQAGKSFKSSLIHSWNWCTRDSPVFPTRGNLVKISNEMAGFGGGESKFFKSELTLQNNFTRGIFTLTETFKMGYALPFDKRSCPVPLFDRFQMGGPTSLRGFSTNSLGPRQFTDSLGGTFLIESGLQCSFPIIKSAANFARAHLFLNAGLLSDQSLCSTLSKSIKESSLLPWNGMNPNISVGGGLMFKMAESARLELNFSVPLLTQNGIIPNRGVQVGIGMEFL
jgi:outer membrane protein insertion porin family